jgi:hypothetical protein
MQHKLLWKSETKRTIFKKFLHSNVITVKILRIIFIKSQIWSRQMLISISDGRILHKLSDTKTNF